MDRSALARVTSRLRDLTHAQRSHTADPPTVRPRELVTCSTCGGLHGYAGSRRFECNRCGVRWHSTDPHCWVCGSVPDPIAQERSNVARAATG